MGQRWGSDPKVKEWMKEHPKETQKIQARYDELKKLGIDDLLIMAVEKGADVSKVAGMLMAKIIAAEGSK